MFFVLQEPWLRVWEWLPVDTRLSKGTFSGDKMLAINYKREILFSKRRTILTKYSRNFSLVILKKMTVKWPYFPFFYHYFATNAFLRDKVYSIRCIFSLGTYLFRTLCALCTLYTLVFTELHELCFYSLGSVVFQSPFIYWFDAVKIYNEGCPFIDLNTNE